ncbi:unnamed protein product [Ranitomeya imitator]|uniref:Protein-L-isoaspartate(D-aspartate) O-methyltransferase n=1 Tax=Ranitomeya imitator TaxID=111125 RepID=A0ABN9LEB5_9NEOB|nr:unnamed protein product [Ranitomeya imitator]
MPALGVVDDASRVLEEGVATGPPHGAEPWRGPAHSFSGGPADDVSWLEVLGFLGKLLGAVAALKAAEYLLRALCVAMAWKSGGASHSELVGNLRKNAIIKSDKVYEVMLATDRKHYAKCNPYMDSPQSIGYQATISAPHMHAYALELLHDQLHDGAKALDVGSGSGILTACFARMGRYKAPSPTIRPQLIIYLSTEWEINVLVNPFTTYDI